MRYLIRTIIVLFSISALVSCNKSDCGPQECLNNGVCEKGICECPDGFEGLYCELDACASANCQNGATCNNGVCDCPPGFEGTNCSTVIVPSSVRITKVVLTNVPINPSSDAYDIMINIKNENQFSVYSSSEIKMNTNNSQDYTFVFSPAYVISGSDIYQNFRLELFDYDPPVISYNDFITSVYFNVFSSAGGLPTFVTATYNDLQAEIYLEYTF